MALSDILRETAYLQGGGKPQGERDIDKINNVFKTIGGMGATLSETAKQSLLKKQAELQAKASEQQIAKGERELKTVGQLFPGEVGLAGAPDLSGNVVEEKRSASPFANLTIGELETVSKVMKNMEEGKKKGALDFKDLQSFRKEFIDRPEVKDYVTVSTNINAMESLLNSVLKGEIKNKAALDQGLITMYNKLTDPNSVVRESEYARTPENLPFLNRISGAIQKVQSGGAGLTDDDRAALVAGAKIIANERGKTFQTAKGSYSTLSGQFGVDPSLVVGTIPDFKPYEMGNIPLAGTARGQTGGVVMQNTGGKPKKVVQNGFTYTFNEETGQYE